MKTKRANPLPKMAPGAVCAQMIRCGRANCRCARGHLHGPYHYHFARAGGRLVKRYVRAGDVDRVRAACEEARAEEGWHRAERRLGAAGLREVVERLREAEKHLLGSPEGQYA